jgi:hypothetical protein
VLMTASACWWIWTVCHDLAPLALVRKKESKGSYSCASGSLGSLNGGNVVTRLLSTIAQDGVIGLRAGDIVQLKGRR